MDQILIFKKSHIFQPYYLNLGPYLFTMYTERPTIETHYGQTIIDYTFKQDAHTLHSKQV